MFTIANGREYLYQWDSDVKLYIDEKIAPAIDEIHFSAKYSRECLTVAVVHEESGSYAMIPNIMLQSSYDIIAYGYCCTDKNTKYVYEIPVLARPKPADYVYTETEIIRFSSLENRISKLENENGATLEHLQEQIDDIIADMNYIPIEITQITGDTIMAKGATLTGKNITWKLNKDPVRQTLDDKPVDVSVRSKALTGLAIIENTAFTLVVTDERGATDQAKVNIYFHNKIYFGALLNGVLINSSAIMSLTGNARSDRNITFTASTTPNQRIAFALPVSYGTPTFKDVDSGFKVDMYLAATISLTHGKYTDDYNVWLSTNLGLGTTKIAVT